VPAHLKAVSGSVGAPQLICLASAPGRFAFFGSQNVMIMVWLSAATGADVELLATAIRPNLKLYPRGQSHIHLVKNGAGMPTAEARAGFAAQMAQYDRQLACVAVALLGRGFWASALQGAITGMRMLAPRSFEMRTHSDLEDIVEWLPDAHGERTGVFLDPAELLAAMNQALLAGSGAPTRAAETSG
jgi:hypothetical protein